jgi:hypothetical protein
MEQSYPANEKLATTQTVQDKMGKQQKTIRFKAKTGELINNV